MRLLTTGVVLLLGCASAGHDNQEESGAERRSSATQAESCAATSAAKLFGDATQITYDYQPLTARALLERSTVIVRGRMAAMYSKDLGDQNRAVFAV